MQLKDKVISKVYPGKVLEGKGQFFNFYLANGTKKYGWFAKKGSTIPDRGMFIALMEFEEVQQGEYLNNKVKSIVWKGMMEKGSKVPDKFNAGIKDHPIWFCVSYCKDLEVARLHGMGSEQLSQQTLKSLAMEVSEAALDMYDRLQAPKSAPEANEEEPPPQEEESPPEEQDEIPY